MRNVRVISKLGPEEFLGRQGNSCGRPRDVSSSDRVTIFSVFFFVSPSLLPSVFSLRSGETSTGRKNNQTKTTTTRETLTLLMFPSNCVSFKRVVKFLFGQNLTIAIFAIIRFALF